jgi:hypothetical protein
MADEGMNPTLQISSAPAQKPTPCPYCGVLSIRSWTSLTRKSATLLEPVEEVLVVDAFKVAWQTTSYRAHRCDPDVIEKRTTVQPKASAIKIDAERREKAGMTVRCPVCHADPGSRCVSVSRAARRAKGAGGVIEMAHVHPQRWHSAPAYKKD